MGVPYHDDVAYLHGGSQAAKRMLYTGETVAGSEAVRLGFALSSHPGRDQLFEEADALLEKISRMSRNQLAMMKQSINHFCGTNLDSTQQLATYFDGIARHTKEGIQFKKECEELGVKGAINKRDKVPSKLCVC